MEKLGKSVRSDFSTFTLLIISETIITEKNEKVCLIVQNLYKMEMRDLDLIDALYERVGCDYISSLRNPRNYPAIALVISRMEPEDYPLRQWQDAAHYISGQNEIFHSSSEARAFLKSFLSQNNNAAVND